MTTDTSWAPEQAARAQTRLAVLTQQIAEEHAIADALSTHADEHRSRAWKLEGERAAIEKALAEADGGQ